MKSERKIMKNAGIMAKALCLAIFLMISTKPFVYGETIGSWDILSAPVSATFQTGDPNVVIDWLNIHNVDITISEAFSGMSVIDDGLGNLPMGSVIEMTFEPDSAVNISGNDLVIFEARYDLGAYSFSTNYDNFSSILAVAATDFSYTGIQRDYYYGIDWGPFSAEVWGAPIDLSLVGIPEGAFVNTIRLVTTYSGTDPLGVGSLTIPEPATVLLVGLGGILLRRKIRNQK